jgi:UDP-3-O-[3-hydroxymyristoyl] glucosamine N-acyltransferase
MATVALQTIAEHVHGTLHGPGELEIAGIAPAEMAANGFMTFAENESYLRKALSSQASALLIPKIEASIDRPCVRVENVRVAFAKILELFHPEALPSPGIHPSAVIDPTATVDETVHIGPNCVVEAHAILSPGVILTSQIHVGARSSIGKDSKLFPRVTLYPSTMVGERVRIHAGAVIGSDGYGYVLDQGVHRKIPQVGNVIIGDDVEIGANTTIDCGALGATRIGKGSKIDNLVQIGHNVVIGDHSIVIAQSGIAGSTRVGNYVILAGQSGIAGHLSIGDKAVVAAQSGVMHSIPAGEKWMGSPAQPDRKAKRQLIAITRLPELIGQLKKFLPG